MAEGHLNNTKFIQIYLFDPSGNFYWCNGSADVDVENQGVLHAGLFATLYNFSLETLGEKLNYLILNELRINLFSIIDKFLVAIVTPRFLKVDPRQIRIIQTKIKRIISETNKISEAKLIDLLTENLNQLLQELFDWVDHYVSLADTAMNVFTGQMNKIEESEIGVFLYTWDSNRVFKYIPDSNVIDYQIEEVIDESINNIEFLSNLNRSCLVKNNTIIYFLVSDLILILTKSYRGDDITTHYNDVINHSSYFSDLLEKVELGEELGDELVEEKEEE